MISSNLSSRAYSLIFFHLCMVFLLRLSQTTPLVKYVKTLVCVVVSAIVNNLPSAAATMEATMEALTPSPSSLSLYLSLHLFPASKLPSLPSSWSPLTIPLSLLLSHTTNPDLLSWLHSTYIPLKDLPPLLPTYNTYNSHSYTATLPTYIKYLCYTTSLNNLVSLLSPLQESAPLLYLISLHPMLDAKTTMAHYTHMLQVCAQGRERRGGEQRGQQCE